MRKLLPFALLIPAVLLVGVFMASQYGYASPNSSPTHTLLGAAAWTLLFFILHGHMRGWRSVRVLLVIFVVGKFAAILYRQLAFGSSIGRVFMELGGATILAWLLFGFFLAKEIER